MSPFLHLKVCDSSESCQEIEVKNNSHALVDRGRVAAFSTLVNAVRRSFTVDTAPITNTLTKLLVVTVFLTISAVLALNDAVGNLRVAVRTEIIDLASVSAVVVDARALWTNHRVNVALSVVLAETFALVDFTVNSSEAVKAVASESI